jgi:hypothetical protein
MSKPGPEIFTSAFVLPDELAAAAGGHETSAEDGLRRLDDLMVVLEALGGPHTARPSPVVWKIFRL